MPRGARLEARNTSSLGAALQSDAALRRELETRLACATRFVHEPLLHPRFHQVEAGFLRPTPRVVGRGLEQFRRFFPLLTSEVNPRQAISCNTHVGLKLHRLSKLLRGIYVPRLMEQCPSEVRAGQSGTVEPHRIGKCLGQVLAGDCVILEQVADRSEEHTSELQSRL